MCLPLGAGEGRDTASCAGYRTDTEGKSRYKALEPAQDRPPNSSDTSPRALWPSVSGVLATVSAHAAAEKLFTRSLAVPGYLTQITDLPLGGRDLHIRSLSDNRQYDDLQGQADRAGISSAEWGHFGQIWPSGRVLAQAMYAYHIEGKRILELGCGLGLASLVLARRGADITASDHHPLAEQFLAYNAGLNGLPMPVYRDLPWSADAAELGTFDLIIGSDILYERSHSRLLAVLLDRLAQAHSEIVISDPGRGNSGRMTHALVDQGYRASEERQAFALDELPPFRGRILRFTRGAACGKIVSALSTTIHAKDSSH